MYPQGKIHHTISMKSYDADFNWVMTLNSYVIIAYVFYYVISKYLNKF